VSTFFFVLQFIFSHFSECMKQKKHIFLPLAV